MKFIVPSFKGSLGEHLQVSENNSSHTFVELLRGKDGLPGRDGLKVAQDLLDHKERRDLLDLRVEEPPTSGGGSVHVLHHQRRFTLA